MICDATMPRSVTVYFDAIRKWQADGTFLSFTIQLCFALSVQEGSMGSYSRITHIVVESTYMRNYIRQ